MKQKLCEAICRCVSPQVLGIDIEAARVNYAEVAQHAGILTLKQGGSLPIGQGGEAEALKKLAIRVGGKGMEFACALSAPELIVRSFHFPQLANKELQKAIRMEAEAAILDGHSLDEMTIDWQRTWPSCGGGIEGVLAVVPRSTVAARTEGLHKAGLRPSIVDVKALALWNAFWQLTSGKGTGAGPTLLVNVTEHATNLIIAQERQELFLVRDLETEANAADEWIAEIRDSLAYARSKSGLKKLEAAYITGAAAQEAIAASLAAAIGLQVPVWDPLRYLKPEPQGAGAALTDGRSLGVAIGLALRKL